MQLGKIQADDLMFSGDIEDDRTNTYLTLNDYDWMSYSLSTRFRTEKYGELQVEFSYFGTTTSLMKINRVTYGISEEYEFEYPTKIFQKHITLFLNNHIAAWNSEYAFNGEDYVLAFYNEVIDVGTLISII